MEKKFDYVLDAQGRPVEGATVLVNTYPAGVLATIYSDEGVTEIENPMVTDADGFFEFYADDGHYTWVITTDTDTKTISDVFHGTGVADVDAAASAAAAAASAVAAALSRSYAENSQTAAYNSASAAAVSAANALSSASSAAISAAAAALQSASATSTVSAINSEWTDYTPDIGIDAGGISAATINLARYKLNGKTAHFHVSFDFTVTSGAPTTIVAIYPESKYGKKAAMRDLIGLVVNGVPEIGYMQEEVHNYCSFHRFGGGAFSGDCSVFGSFTVEFQ